MNISDLKEIAKTAGIRSRHVDKCVSFAEIVEKVFEEHGVKYNKVSNLFCGNGLASWYWTMQGVEVKSFDINYTTKYKKIKQLVGTQLQDKNTFIQKDLRKSSSYEGVTGLATAIHACDDLSDVFINNCIEYQLPFALVTCCHDRDTFVLQPEIYPDGRLYSNKTFDEYQDLIRAQFVQEHGYQVVMRSLPQEFTKKNTVIVGIPS
jgi:hypothetical protein